MTDQTTRLRHRLLEERELAKSAAYDAAREAHARFARRYEERLAHAVPVDTPPA